MAEEERISATLLKDTPKSDFHLHPYFSSPELLSPFFLRAPPQPPCICVTFLKQSVKRNEKTIQGVILQHIGVLFLFLFCPCRFSSPFFENRMTANLVYHISLPPLPVQTQQVLMATAGFSINNTGKKCLQALCGS